MSAKWAVTCGAYTTPPRSTKESAERLLAEIESAGHCLFPHAIVEVSVRRCDSCNAAGPVRYSHEHGAYFCDGCYEREVER